MTCPNCYCCHCQCNECDSTNVKEKIPYRDEWPTNSAKLIKLRAHWYALHDAVKAKRKTNVAYQEVLDMIEASMNELGLEYEK